MKDLRYPIGNFELRPFDEVTKKDWLNDFRNLPKDLENVVKNLNQNQLDTPYREGGWTVQQVVHHLADSHMNCFIYFKLTLTEDLPIIKDYNENDWSNTTDVIHTPINFSINLQKDKFLKQMLYKLQFQFLLSFLIGMLYKN